MMTGSFMRLAWKDAMLVKSLVLLVIGAIAATNAGVVAAHFMNPNAFRDGSITILFWSLFPNLLAFGLPALLIGTEAESGTLAWLRTLPIPRYKVIYSKVLVAVASVAIIWALSSLTLLLVGFIVPRFDLIANLKNQQPSDMLTVGYFSTLLLLSGFVTSYAFRSPIAALLAVLPMTMVGYTGFFVLFGTGISGQQWHWNDRTPLLVAAGYLILLIVIQHRLALLRLRPAFGAGGDESRSYSVARAVSISAKQSPTDLCLNLQLRLPIPRLVRTASRQELLKRPPTMRALLWQAGTQQAVAVAILAPIVMAAGLLISFSFRGPFNDALVLPISLGMCWLGATTFYADTLRRRHLFFAERGISRNQVWLSRMALPSAAILVCASAICIWHAIGPSGSLPLSIELVSVPLSVGLVGFAIGSLMSMSAARPVLGWIVSPVVLAVVLAMLAFFLQDYSHYWPAVALAAVPILFATWRLLPRWSLGRRGIGFDARVVAYLLLGILLVCVYVFGHRVATIPAELPEWREKTFARTTGTSYTDSSLTEDYLIARQAIYTVPRSPREYAERLPGFMQQVRDVREAVVRGDVSPAFLFAYVEQDEQAALTTIWQYVEIQDMPITSQTASLWLDSMATDSLRRQSREAALIHEWKEYQAQYWRDEKLPGSPYGPKKFLDKPVAERHSQYSFERLRADRFVDTATKATLDYLRRPASKSDQAAIKRIERLWRNVFDVSAISDERATPFSFETDIMDSELREKLEAIAGSNAVR